MTVNVPFNMYRVHLVLV